MRDPKRIDNILQRIKKVWKEYPDLRLMQFLMNVEGQCGTPLYYLEDDKLIETIETFYNEIKNISKD